MTTPPLNELLAAWLEGFTSEFMRVSGTDRMSLSIHANLLRFVPDDGVALRDVPHLARLSKRMAKWHVDGATRRGWAVQADKRVELTDDGSHARDVFRRSIEEMRTAPALRGPLEAIVGRFDLELPHYPRDTERRIQALPAAFRCDGDADTHSASKAYRARYSIRAPKQNLRIGGRKSREAICTSEAGDKSGAPSHATKAR